MSTGDETHAVTATLSLESPELALTGAVDYDSSAAVAPVLTAGTVPGANTHLFTVRSESFERFEDGLEADSTITSYERVTTLHEETVYRFEYAPDALVFSTFIAAHDGVALDWRHHGTTWIVRVWLPTHTALSNLHDHATSHDIDITLQRVTHHAPTADSDTGLTDAQRETLQLALESGYFEEPRATSLQEIADELDISQPAAGGRLRRGIRHLLQATLGPDR